MGTAETAKRAEEDRLAREAEEALKRAEEQRLAEEARKVEGERQAREAAKVARKAEKERCGAQVAENPGKTKTEAGINTQEVEVNKDEDNSLTCEAEDESASRNAVIWKVEEE